MNERPEEWSLHAHVTISHPGIGELSTNPVTRTERDENGTLRMVYTWTSDPNPFEARWTPSRESNHPQEPAREYRKGNIVFTSVPPRKNVDQQPKFYQKDSGYSSELLSPTSFASSSLPRKPPLQPYNRRCRSTCSIVLSTTIHQEQQQGDEINQCTRTHSLRCQTPNAKSDVSASSFYGCGDPWCHHSTYREDSAGRFSPLRETTEEDETTTTYASKKPSRANTYTAASSVSGQSCSNQASGGLKDACVQTTEVVDKCTSPLIPASGFANVREKQFDTAAKKNVRRRALYGSRTKTEPIYLPPDSPSTFTPDSLEPTESSKRVVSNPAKVRRRTPVSKQMKKPSLSSDSKSSEPSKKPRTVHIDVYCTGTDLESGSTSESESENKSTSTPQTVFESNRMRITHARASDKDIPHKLIKDLQIDSKEKLHDESDNEDDASTAYPSPLSSYSRLASLSSFNSGFPLSWSTYSTSSCAVPDNDYDSVTNTSWKDTFSDIESLRLSKSSIANTESTDFVPTRNLSAHLKSTGSIEETPEFENNSPEVLPSNSFEYIDNLKKKRQQLRKFDCSSQASLQGSDSFEYANSEDRRRIRTMEEVWKSKGDNKPAKKNLPPALEKKHLIQQEKMKAYFSSRMSDKSLTKEESESDSSCSERGWTFEKDDDKKLERDVTVRRTSKQLDSPKVLVSNVMESLASANTTKTTTAVGPLRTPSYVAFQKRLKFDPTLKAPFMLLPGVYTDQRSVAKRFGSVVDAFKKPGHHIGPAKNPHCLCDHCKRYFENFGERSRAMSTGDVSKPSFLENWKRDRYASQPRDS